MVDLSGKQIDNYRLLGLLGQGSFGAVYLAENVYRKNQVAVKILQMQFSVEEFHEFVNEARIFRLRHPNIVSVLDFGIERASNIPFIVMDYAPNGTLRKRHPKGARVPLEKIVVYSRQIAAGLQYAHEENLVHRDLKPENLLFGAKDEVLLSDFGIAVISQSGRTAQAALNSAGTPYYMAPEQFLGKPSRASDQYALGVIVYEWLSGVRPFNGTFYELFGQHQQVSPPPLPKDIPLLNADIERVVLKALAKEPKSRYGSVLEFAQALENVGKKRPDVTEIPAVILRSEGQRAEKNSVSQQEDKDTVVTIPDDKLLIQAYKKVQDGTITDPETIRAIGQKFMALANNPERARQVSFDAERAASNLFGRARSYEEIYREQKIIQSNKTEPSKMLGDERKEGENGRLEPRNNPISKGTDQSKQTVGSVVRAIQLPEIKSSWRLPGTQLLNAADEEKLQRWSEDTSVLVEKIQETLRSFRVDAEVRQEDVSIGPTIIRFGIRPTGKPEMRLDEKTRKMVPVRDAAGNLLYETRTRVSRIMALQNDLALVLEAKTIRMEAPVPGRPYVGVEIPNKNSRLVMLREVLETEEYQSAKGKSKLAIGLGKDVGGVVRVGDLAKMPHLLIAGASGSGKSVFVRTIISSILTQAAPDDVRLLMIDLKRADLSIYNGIPHLLEPVVTGIERVVPLLKNAVEEMERRYRLLSQLGLRNLDSYRKLRIEKIARGDPSLSNLPAIVIIINELADLMMVAPEEVEGMIVRLAQLARATGIHLVVATQSPSVDVITGLIKANIPTRISFMVSLQVDSRTIIDMGGAERLLGRGDMLYMPADAGRPERIQGAFLADEEVQALVEYWKEQIDE